MPDGKFARAYWMRQGWFDKLGQKTPENVDELYTALTVLRNDDASWPTILNSSKNQLAMQTSFTSQASAWQSSKRMDT
jgi:ABC-type glycerol-3-phosphate transport system substrate-binding protein